MEKREMNKFLRQFPKFFLSVFYFLIQFGNQIETSPLKDHQNDFGALQQKSDRILSLISENSVHTLLFENGKDIDKICRYRNKLWRHLDALSEEIEKKGESTSQPENIFDELTTKVNSIFVHITEHLRNENRPLTQAKGSQIDYLSNPITLLNRLLCNRIHKKSRFFTYKKKQERLREDALEAHWDNCVNRIKMIFKQKNEATYWTISKLEGLSEVIGISSLICEGIVDISPQASFDGRIHLYRGKLSALLKKWLDEKDMKGNYHFSVTNFDQFMLRNVFSRLSKPELQKLFSKQVLYLCEEERGKYELSFKKKRLMWNEKRLQDDNYIYVLSHEGKSLYIGKKNMGHFHHSSLIAGEAVQAAGRLIVKNGKIVEITNSSGHYTPPPSSLEAIKRFLGSPSRLGNKVTKIQFKEQI
jgi:hypothetical protein